MAKLDRIGWFYRHIFSPLMLFIYHIQWPLREHKTLLNLVENVECILWRLWGDYTVKNGWLPPECHRQTIDALFQLMKEDYVESLKNR